MITRAPAKLIVECVDTRVQGFVPRKVISDLLSYSVPGAFHMPAFKEKRWDGRARLFQGSKFPTGCVDLVTDLLDNHGYKYVIDDRRPDLDFDPNMFNLPGIKFRPYQVNTIARMLDAMQGYISVATGGGKTLIAGGLIKGLQKPSAFLVHNSILFDQAVKSFGKYFGPDNVGAYRGGHTQLRPITVFMVQALRHAIGNRRRMPVLEQFRVMIVDECHHVASDGQKAQWYQVARRFKGAPYRFGMTATPQKRKWKILMHGALGPEIVSVEVDTLQEAGYLAPTRCEFFKIDEPDLYRAKYFKAYREGIVENVVRNEYSVKCALEQAGGRRVILIIVQEVKHGRTIQSMLRQKNKAFDMVFLHGEWTKTAAKRKQLDVVLDKVKDRQIDIVIATRGLFGEGVDIPVLDCIINLAGGKSDIAFRQVLGRGLRIEKDKDQLYYIDFVDEQNPHLLEHSQLRIAECRKMNQPVEVSTMR